MLTILVAGQPPQQWYYATYSVILLGINALTAVWNLTVSRGLLEIFGNRRELVSGERERVSLQVEALRCL